MAKGWDSISAREPSGEMLAELSKHLDTTKGDVAFAAIEEMYEAYFGEHGYKTGNPDIRAYPEREEQLDEPVKAVVSNDATRFDL